MDKFLFGKQSTSPAEDDEPCTSSIAKKRKIVNRKYSEDYIRYGFYWCGDEAAPKPLCVICNEQLTNDSMVPSKLNRHAKKDISYFQRLLAQNLKQKKFMMSTVSVSDKALEASYYIAKLIAREKKPHTIGEKLIKPACMEIVRVMLGPKEVQEVSKVSLSAETIKRRIGDMSTDILNTLILKLIVANNFALQIDESTDIKNQAQLIAIVRFVDEDCIKENFYFVKNFPNELLERIFFE
ncbi:protein FAM200B-like [Diorhabda carinulata]|uniref:protein FAM200B-like n=1 Tax=Diorhabda carinulata TaxID=1163345 RepID=UPI0025A1EA4E|nr:protein FAM200B-like [Diorhabda carinulata]